MLNLKKVIVIVAILYLAQAKFEICFNLVADDTQNLHQAKCAEVASGGNYIIKINLYLTITPF